MLAFRVWYALLQEHVEALFDLGDDVRQLQGVVAQDQPDPTPVIGMRLRMSVRLLQEPTPKLLLRCTSALTSLADFHFEPCEP